MEALICVSRWSVLQGADFRLVFQQPLIFAQYSVIDETYSRAISDAVCPMDRSTDDTDDTRFTEFWNGAGN